MPLTPKLLLPTPMLPLPTYALSSQVAKNHLLPSLHAQQPAGWTRSRGLGQGSVPATSCGLIPMPTAWRCDSPSVTDHRTYCHHSSLVCVDLLLRRGELSTCQIVTASFLLGRSVPSGPDSHALILSVFGLSSVWDTAGPGKLGESPRALISRW